MTATDPHLSKGTIAVDLDDVLCDTNQRVAEMHNEFYGTDMTVDDFDFYLYWQNKYWGTPAETAEKVVRIYQSGLFSSAKPIPGAKHGCLTLKTMGYRLIIVTARDEAARRADTEAWLLKYFPGVFDEIWFSGDSAALKQSVKDHDTTGTITRLEGSGGCNGNGIGNGNGGGSGKGKGKERELPVPKVAGSKAEIVRKTNSLFLIDDSLEHALDLAHSSPPIKTILLGTHRWSFRESRARTAEDMLSYEERVGRGMELPPEMDLGGYEGVIGRARDWEELGVMVWRGKW